MLKYAIRTQLDDPDTTLLHRDIIESKPFLKSLYTEWYTAFLDASQHAPEGKLLEIGSGGGFLKQLMPGVITSDIMKLEGCDMTFSAERMPFAQRELSGIFMLNVFHHIPDPSLFLKEAVRTLRSGGQIVMIEPANSPLGRFIYKRFHHESFDPAAGWQVVSTGPMSSSNQALPYIYFERDRRRFEERFPELQIDKITYHTPFRYVLSGGVSRKAVVPSWSFGFWTFLETILSPLSKWVGLFVTIELSRIESFQQDSRR